MCRSNRLAAPLCDASSGGAFREVPQATHTAIPPMTGQQWGSIVVLAGTLMLLAIDGTALSLAVPRLTADLEPSATELL